MKPSGRGTTRPSCGSTNTFSLALARRACWVMCRRSSRSSTTVWPITWNTMASSCVVARSGTSLGSRRFRAAETACS